MSPKECREGRIAIGMHVPGRRLVATAALVFVLLAFAPQAARADEAVEMQKKLQNPLANISAVMTYNTIGFDTGDDEGTSYGFQIQPVYAIDFPDAGFTMIPRGIIPIMGLEPGTDVPIVGQPSGTSSTWGLGDTMAQLYFAPHTKSSWKWGVGPQISIPTATKTQLEGPQWGAGVAGVLVGNFTEKLAFTGIMGNHWGNDGKFNAMILQPLLFYTVGQGKSIAYVGTISADWEASSSNRWTVPIGLSWNQTFDLGGGYGFDYMIGPYYNVARPDGAAGWQIIFGISFLLPK